MYRHCLSEIFKKEHIELWSVLPKEELTLQNPELWSRKSDFPLESAIIFAVPYFGGWPKNISAYAAAGDYHAYIASATSRICQALKEAIPRGNFLGFADHSPIDERLAAVKSGIGVFGGNGLVLTEKHSSFIFLGDILTDLPAQALGYTGAFPIRTCEMCGACKRACPTGILRGDGDRCLSAVTQRKGALTKEEIAWMRAIPTAWGCDECQKHCPWTKRAMERGTLFTKIPYFLEDRIEELTVKGLEEMPKERFLARAFAWRGKATVLRNAEILESEEDNCHARPSKPMEN